jgi:ribose-phosphate pyrophosphokinase
MSVTLVSTRTSTAFARRLAERLGAGLVEVERRTFPDGELYLRYPLADPFGLLGQDVVIVGATESQSSLDEVYRLGCAAGKGGARLVVLVIPYFGYSTMERATKPGEVVSAKVIARQLSAIPRSRRGNWVLLMDLHSAGIVHYFEGDTVAQEIYAEPRIVEAIEALGLERLCLASADMGRAKWVETFANHFHAPVALIHKKRLSGSETKVGAVVGDVSGMDVVIFDDMIRSGSSLIGAAETYARAGARSVRAVATHLVLPPGSIERLESSPLERIIGTDTHPNHQLVAGRGKFEVVSVAGLFADVLARLVA